MAKTKAELQKELEQLKRRLESLEVSNAYLWDFVRELQECRLASQRARWQAGMHI